MKIGKKRVLIAENGVIELKEFKKERKENLDFTGIKYRRCTFLNIDFKNVRFENVIFEKCTFQFCTFTNCSIASNSILGIYNTELINLNFSNCNLKNIIIRKSYLKTIAFKDTFLGQCNLVKNSYEKVKFIDECILNNCLIKGTRKRFDVQFINNRKNSRLNLASYVGGFNYNIIDFFNKGRPEFYNEISNSYLAFANQYLKNDLGDKYGYCFYESKKADHKTLKGWRKLKSFTSYWVCGYGEKPFRAFSFSLIIVLICSILYLFGGVRIEDKVIQYNLNNVFSKSFLTDFLYCFHFSLVTFATVGYGNITPEGTISIIIANTEIMFGVLMIAIWTSTLVRKMTR
ncbi:hypothetical protein UT300019_30730 [Clostridium sp. CTA-19]